MSIKSLKNKSEKIKKDIATIEQKIKNLMGDMEPCVHGVRFGAKRPYLCETCAMKYVMECEKYGLYYDMKIYKKYKIRLESDKRADKFVEKLISDNFGEI